MALGASYGVTNNNDVAFVLNGFHGTRMDGSIKQQAPASNGWSVQWHPAFDFAVPETLIHPAGDMTTEIIFAKQFCLLCAAEIQQIFFKHFLSGVAKQLDRIDQGQSQIPGAVELKALSREARKQKDG